MRYAASDKRSAQTSFNASAGETMYPILCIAHDGHNFTLSAYSGAGIGSASDFPVHVCSGAGHSVAVNEQMRTVLADGAHGLSLCVDNCDLFAVFDRPTRSAA